MNVTPWVETPAEGAVPRVVNEKVPGGVAEPPVRLELAKVCPKVMALAVGPERIVEVALATVSVLVTDP